MKPHLLVSLSIVFYLLSQTNQAFAYRGQEFIEQSPPRQTFMNRFPGYFDVNMAPENQVVLETPTLVLDYGVTENLTVGTSLLPIGIAAFSLNPALHLKARYRFYSDKNIVSTITGYLGGFRISKSASGDEGYGTWMGGTSNTLLFLNDRHALGLHLTAGIIHGKGWGQSLFSEGSVSTKLIAPGIGYHFFVSDSWGLEFQAVVPVVLRATAENAGSLEIAELSSTGPLLTPFRFATNFRTSRDSVMTLGILSGIGEAAFPLISWTVVL